MNKEEIHRVRSEMFNIPDLCPDCGGLGFTRGEGGIYDYRDCPNRLCNNGRLDITEEDLETVSRELLEIIRTRDWGKENELAQMTGVCWKKIASMRVAMMESKK